VRILPTLQRGLPFLHAICAATFALACDQLPAGQSLWIRLTSPVSTYTAKPGDPVHAVLTQDLACENEVLLPMGTHVEGLVRSKRKVGWGIHHETASLELEFNRATEGPDEPIRFTARVDEIENAREPVHNGVIQGIRSSDTFQGSINSRLIHLPTWNPYSDPVLIIYKAIFPIFPEPEIYYPAGTDMRLRTTTDITLPQSSVTSMHDSFEPNSPESNRLEALVGPLPWRVTTSNNVNADVINLIFVGSQDQVSSAFHESGWDNADPVSRRSVAKNLYALLNQSGYAREPMMTFYLNGKPEDMNWQKGLNSYDRRDHLRIWQWTSTETAAPVWIASSTHDTRAVLAIKHLGFVHHITPEIDDERSTIIRDLDFAGCVRSVTYVSRPEIPASTRNATGDLMRTDGEIAVVTLQPCDSTVPQSDSEGEIATYRPGNHVFRFMRRQILTFRSDIFRANIIYGTFDVGRMAWRAMRHKPPPEQTMAQTEMPHVPSR
jgi:LssY C-terminus